MTFQYPFQHQFLLQELSRIHVNPSFTPGG
jgi:hypothetical protein